MSEPKPRGRPFAEERMVSVSIRLPSYLLNQIPKQRGALSKAVRLALEQYFFPDGG